jgi:FkbH-like protein
VTLREALIAAARVGRGDPYRLHLCCGFEPLHLITFLKARMGRPVELSTGLFGDFTGNLERAIAGGGPIAAVIEWPDVDPRLGLREAYVPSRSDEESILADAADRLAGWQRMLSEAAASRRIVLALPSAPLPAWFGGLAGQTSAFVLQLRSLQSSFAAGTGVRVLESLDNGYDLRSHLSSGFPYSIAHTDTLAERIAGALFPPLPAKGLITDLDDTLWSGIVGEAGPANVHWGLEHHARAHGIYQQFLAGLASQGVLVGVASKNDPEPVAEAMARPDFLLPREAIFPVETNWQSKSESIRRIARKWNIGLDSIVFVDDNPLELAEVKEMLPEVECHRFEPAGVLELIETLQTRFAKEAVTEEDRLRSASLRSGAELAASSGDPEKLLAGLEAQVHVVFDKNPFDPRALELLNKTNQFNLNGRRWEESEFRAFLARPEAVLGVVSYQDRLGQLGKIGIVVGESEGERLLIKSWVLSCRAFSRRIEFHTLNALFGLGHTQIEFDWLATARNTPTREMLKILLEDVPEGGTLSLSRTAFQNSCPPLYTKGSIGSR